MICSKCGNEFQGTSCPKCDSPAILVNASDYEKRKREWEEREKLKNAEEAKKQRNKEDIRRIAVEIANTDYKKAMASNANIFVRFAVKHRKLITVFATVIILAVVAVFTGIKMMAAKNMQIYVSDGSYIYKGTVANDALCKKDDIVYNSAQTKAFSWEIPNGVDKNSVISSMCSDNGKYFAAVEYKGEKVSVSGNASYSEDTIGESGSAAVNGNALSEGIYTVYAWKKGGQPYIAASDKNEKTLYNISDDGILVFTDTEYMNEGAVHAISLNSADISEERSVVHSENISEFLLTGKYGVWLTTDGALCYGEPGAEGFVKLAENVRQIYAQTGVSVYSHDNGCIQDKKMSSFIYGTVDNEFIKLDMSDVKKIKKKFLFAGDGLAENIIYESGYGCAYTISREGIVRITDIPVKDNVEDDGTRRTERIDGILTVSDFFYDEDKSGFYYAGESGELIRVLHGKNDSFNKDVILSGVAGRTVKEVMGTHEAFTCIAGENLYYVQPDKKEPVLIKSGVSPNTLIQSAVSGRKIYYVHEGILYSVPVNGETSGEIGKVKEIWLGSINLK
ncbi:MAG: hypothetical protein PUE71_09845 [Clostridia bacterium]|nr:hypothetical protein [Clostridia bacterium]